MFSTGNSMNNLLSHCGLVDARIRASETDLPLPTSDEIVPWEVLLVCAHMCGYGNFSANGCGEVFRNVHVDVCGKPFACDVRVSVDENRLHVFYNVSRGILIAR